jgi:hypothetical protein
VGPVEIWPETTLSDLRRVIASTLDAETVPAHYQFCKADGTPVGTRKEPSLLASKFLPSIKLLPTTESPLAGKFCMKSLASPELKCCGRSDP